MKKTKFLLLLFFFIISTNFLYSKCRRIAEVKYQTESGWSKKYQIEVTFISGSELNDATNSYKFSSSSNYVVIFWEEGKATIIKLSTSLLCGFNISCDCIDNSITDFKGYDQDGDLWNICINDMCF